MKAITLAPLVAAVFLSNGCGQNSREGADRGEPGAQARAELRSPSGEQVGTATFTDTGRGVDVAVEVKGLPAGQHGIHVHQMARCDAPDFESAGDHFNPASKQHGAGNPQGKHAGDLGNIEVAADGRGSMRSLSADLSLGKEENSLLSGQGTSLVLHADPDDQKSDPAGNSGARIACGVIEK
jgi:superoxide dismutase, Cu-Zn family